MKPLISAVSFIALAGVLLATAVTLNDAQISSTQSANEEPSAAVTGALNAELARCNAIDPEAANDAICKAVWEANRKRFFESRKSPSAGEVPKATPRSPATPSADAWQLFGDTPGARPQ